MEDTTADFFGAGRQHSDRDQDLKMKQEALWWPTLWLEKMMKSLNLIQILFSESTDQGNDTWEVLNKFRVKTSELDCWVGLGWGLVSIYGESNFSLG